MALLLSSCSTKDTESFKPIVKQQGGREEKSYEMPAISQGRFVFKSSDDLKMFSKYSFTNNPETQDEWEKQVGFTSIRRYTSENKETVSLLNSVPLSMSRVLNSNAEVQIDDKIVWFNKGVVYTIAVGEAKNLTVFKQQPNNTKATGSFFSQVIDGNGIATDVNLGAGGGDARYQKEYGLDNNGNDRRKIVYEIRYDFVDTGWGFGTSTLFTNLKLEYRGRCGIFSNPCWQRAGESRTVAYNATVNGSIKFKKFGMVVGTVFINSGNSYQGTVNNDVQSVLFWQDANYPGATPSFEGTVQGYYSTTVNAPNHSQGFYNLNCIW